MAGEEGPRHPFAVDGKGKAAAERCAHQRATVDPWDEVGEVCTHRTHGVSADELRLQRGEQERGEGLRGDVDPPREEAERARIFVADRAQGDRIDGRFCFGNSVLCRPKDGDAWLARRQLVGAETVEGAVGARRGVGFVGAKDRQLKVGKECRPGARQMNAYCMDPIRLDGADRGDDVPLPIALCRVADCADRGDDVVSDERLTAMEPHVLTQGNTKSFGIFEDHFPGKVGDRVQVGFVEFKQPCVHQARRPRGGRIDGEAWVEGLGILGNEDFQGAIFGCRIQSVWSASKSEARRGRQREDFSPPTAAGRVLAMRRPVARGSAESLLGPFPRLLLAGAASAVIFARAPVAASDDAPVAPTAEPAAPKAEAAKEAEATDPAFVDAVAALTGKSLQNAKVSAEVVDVDTGKVLASRDPHALLNPASNAKVYTAACALALLHGNHRYQTTLAGTMKGGEITGALVIRGYGDPTLRTADFLEMARDLHQRGVRRVVGDILVDQRFFDGEHTPPAFEQQPNEWAYFRAPVSALAVNENTVTLHVRPGEEDGNASAYFDPPGFVDLKGSIKTAGEGADTVGLKLAPSGTRLEATVSGSIGKRSGLARYTRRVEDPTLLGGYVLKQTLEQIGIKVGGEVKAGSLEKGNVLVRHESEPLSKVLYALGKQSDNFYAEMVMKSLAGEVKGKPAKTKEGTEACTAWLEKNGLSDTGLVVKNGSGLFDANRVTTASVTKLLRFVHRDAALSSEFVAQLSIGGVDGTLHTRFQKVRHARIVRAKSGTLDDTIALSGYVYGPPGRSPLAFSVIFNGVAGKGSNARQSIDAFVEKIAAYQWRK